MNNFASQPAECTFRIRRLQDKNDMRRARFDKRTSALACCIQVGKIKAHLHRTGDRRRVAPDSRAMLIKNLALAPELFHRPTGKVPDVGVLRNDTQRLLLAASAYDK